MKATVYLSDFRAAFNRAGRGEQFSYEGLELIYDYIDEYERDSGEEIELDVIALCCEWAESTAAEIIEQYDTDIDTEGKDEDEIAAEVEEYLLNETQLAGRTAAGDFVFVQF
jgi:predicted ArsR family transcriptional regulator